VEHLLISNTLKKNKGGEKYTLCKLKEEYFILGHFEAYPDQTESC
jgi:hypothetical protein